MDTRVKEFIEENIALIEDNRWEDVYEKANKLRDDIGKFTETMLAADIHPENYLKEIPAYFLNHSDTKVINIPPNIQYLENMAYWGADYVELIIYNNNQIDGISGQHNRFHGVAQKASSCKFKAGPVCSYIPSRLFANGNLLQFPRITEIDLGDSICEYIGSYAFYNLCNLKSIVFNPQLIRIEKGAFRKCSGLHSLIIPPTIQELGIDAFSGCYDLKNLSLSNNIFLGKDCFAYGPEEGLTITFDGTKAQFRKISSGAFTNTYFTVNCTDGKIVKKKR